MQSQLTHQMLFWSQTYDHSQFYWPYSENCHADGLHFVHDMLLNC